MGEYQRVACEGKVKFDSFTDANRVSSRHNDKNRRVYHCRYCNKFHLGGSVMKKRRP